jgi:uncharacterized protein (DUF433 family)
MPNAMISITPGVMSGRPCIAGTRITVDLVLRRLAEGLSTANIIQEYPHLTEEQVKAAITYAAEQLNPKSPVAAE